jgi:hypothetical protein
MPSQCADQKAKNNFGWKSDKGFDDPSNIYKDATGTYWYDYPTNAPPGKQRLLIWLHGCYGNKGEASVATATSVGSNYGYITLMPDGAESGCWDKDMNPPFDPDRLFKAIASARAHFNIDASQIILGGYSSGGDYAFKFAFQYPLLIAGVLAMDTAPYGSDDLKKNDNKVTLADVQKSAAVRTFNVVLLSAKDDNDTYKPGVVGPELDAMKGLGYTITRITVKGTHFDCASKASADLKGNNCNGSWGSGGVGDPAPIGPDTNYNRYRLVKEYMHPDYNWATRKGFPAANNTGFCSPGLAACPPPL